MAEVEEPQFNSLAERIAALNKQKNFTEPPRTVGKRAPPPPPPNRAISAPATAQATANGTPPARSPAIPPRPTRSTTEKVPPPLPRRTTIAEDVEEPAAPLPGRILAPPLPSRNSQTQVSPALPARRTSSQALHTRRNSNSSDISYLSTISSLSLSQTASSSTSVGAENQPMRRLPPTLDQAKLPPLPPTRRELEAKAKEAAEKEAALQEAVGPIASRIADPPRPSLPPRLPSRPPRSPEVGAADEAAPALPARRLPPQPVNGFRPKSAIESGFSNRRNAANDVPPPIPSSSRPTFAQIDAVATRGAAAVRPAAAPAAGGSCLICRDFTEPDAVAAQHPTNSLPRQDPVGYLAHVLCDPFQSPTDKARAIFTWCHHNIVYDVHGFFNNCIPRGQSPSEMIFSGKAVCEGYAKVFEAVAVRAGLECVVVGGHGKGFGHTPLKEGEAPPPRDPSGHAWNAVRIDGGEWKLLDACWGAGALSNGQYLQRFAPEMFTTSNEHFGYRHFPQNDRHFFRSDGRIPSWEEYMIGPTRGEPATWYGTATEEGLNQWTFTPGQKNIPVRSGEIVRFQFSKICEHWDPIRNGKGKPRLLMMKIHGVDGRKEDHVPLESDGFWWWADIPARDLGAPGQKISLFGLDTLDGQNARGVTKEEFLRKKGRCGMSWVGIAAWELV